MSLAAGRRRWLLLGSLMLFALLALIATVLSSDRASNAPVSLIARPPLRVIVQRPQRTDIVLERAAASEDWRISAPCALPVDQRRLSPLFEALAGGGAHYPRDEVEPVGAGLQPPLATLLVDGEPLQIGGTDLSGTRRYVATVDRVHLVPEWLWALVNGGLSALASAEVVARPIIAVEAIGAVGAVGAVGDRPGDGLVPPAGDHERRSATTTSTDLARWNALQAAQIVPWPLTGTETGTETATAGEREAEREAGPMHEQPAQRFVLTLVGGERLQVELIVTDRFEALVREGAGCAHLLVPGTLNEMRSDSASDLLPRVPD